MRVTASLSADGVPASSMRAAPQARAALRMPGQSTRADDTAVRLDRECERGQATSERRTSTRRREPAASPAHRVDRAHRAPLRLPGAVGRAQLGRRHLAGHLGRATSSSSSRIDVAGRAGRPSRSSSPCSCSSASGRASTSAAGTSARSRRSPPSSRRWSLPPLVLFLVDLPARAGCRSACRSPRCSSPSWAWRRSATRWRLLIERRKRPERRGHRAGARVRRRRGRRAGDHRDAPRSRQPVPAGGHRSTTTPARRTSGSAACRCGAPATDIARVAEETGAEVLLIAIPSADGAAGPRAGRARRRRPGSRCMAVPAGAATSSTTASASTTSGRSPPPTCSAAARSTPTSPASPTTSPAAGCSSPAPAARSAPSCAARCTASARPRW